MQPYSSPPSASNSNFFQISILFLFLFLHHQTKSFTQFLQNYTCRLIISTLSLLHHHQISCQPHNLPYFSNSFCNSFFHRSRFMGGTDSSSNAAHLQLPPGFRFHPTDEELVVHYLKRKLSSSPLPVAIIAEIDLYKFDPWELPSKAVFGKQEWYFFTPRERKYPNGARPNRAAISGYWKATGTDKPILTSNGTQKVGVKKALVFYGGKPPKGVKTNWIMHEYRLVHALNSNSKPLDEHPTTRKSSLKLDDWVLCRIFMKNSAQLSTATEHDQVEEYSMAADVTKPPKLDVSGGHEDSCFLDGFLSSDGNNMINQNGCNISQIPSSSCSSKATNRGPPCQLWNDAVRCVGGAEPLRIDLGNSYGGVTSGTEENTVSFVSLLNQLPIQNAAFQPSAPLVGTLSDGVYRQQLQFPNINWNS